MEQAVNVGPALNLGKNINGYKISDAAAPAKLLLMIEQSTAGTQITVPQTKGDISGGMNQVRKNQNTAGFIRHAGIANALFLDGHVAGLSLTETDYSNAESKAKLDRWFQIK